ncbi:class I SAM-dependent methyltransferase [Gramella jeungdoensis]|uniref:Class I SAM-dependent methyltransferase n=1 Tax=Gramella jeungdoensis TaxID=708091 RepID=A0ABT0YYP6_9FLAO|nr:class I SAM-dependent methyltransferase [Gramella jeungdoensis]MCM8568597.1 class I SAM-dependent methyltransferase [Gramella jeungdoensis]
MEKGKDIGLEFNEFSRNYTNDMIGLAPHYLELVSCFVKYLPVNFNPVSILDLGCGNGNITAQLLPYFPKASYTLVDASAEMIEICRRQFKDFEMEYENKYFREFEFENEKYDLITAGFSLHHCENKEKRSLFKKIFSALKKGGIFSYSDLMISKNNPDHPRVLEEWKNFVNGNFPDGEKWSWVMEHYKAFDRPTDYLLQLEWLKSAGFNNVQFPFKKGYWMYLQAER